MSVYLQSTEVPEVWEQTFRQRALTDTAGVIGPVKIPVGAEYIRWGAFRSPGQTTSEAWAGGTGGANLQLQVSMFEPTATAPWQTHPDTSGNTLTSAGYSTLVSAVGFAWMRAVVSQTGSTSENAMIDVAFRLG